MEWPRRPANPVHTAGACIALMLAILLGAGAAFASDGVTVAGSGGQQTINVCSVCRVVTNNNAASLYVPTSSCSEWHTGGNSFIEHPPSGVVVAACAPTCNTLVQYYICTGGSVIAQGNQASAAACKSWCETQASPTCCDYDIWTANCRATSGAPYTDGSIGATKWAGSCS